MSGSNRRKAVVVQDRGGVATVPTAVADVPGCLTSDEELSLQQLEQARFWSTRLSARQNGKSPMAVVSDDIPSVPEKWELTRGISLHDWQTACIEEWFQSGKRGVLKVVTGAGKTMLALAIAEQLCKQLRGMSRLARSDRRSLRRFAPTVARRTDRPQQPAGIRHWLAGGAATTTVLPGKRHAVLVSVVELGGQETGRRCHEGRS